jgi:hypothetical protein
MSLTDKRENIVHETNYLIDTIIDKCVVEKKKPKFSFYKHFISSGFDKKTIEQVKEYNKKIAEEKEIAQLAYEKSDPFLVEAYSNFSRPHLRQYIELLEEIIHDVEKYHQEKSAARRSSRRKKIDPNKMVKNVKYNTEPVLVGSTSYTSLSPVEIVGCKQVCLYNTKTRELTLYVGDYLKIKGSTIIDFNTDKSWTKTLRKPEEILETAMNCTRNSTKNLCNLINSKEKKPTGRINSNHIIVKVFTI